MKCGWEVKKLGEVCEVIAGQSPEGRFYNTEGVGLPFYQGKKEFSDRYIGSPTTWTTKTTKVARDGDILMSVRAPVGPVNFSTQKICIGRGLAAIRGKEVIDRNFLFYQLLYLQPQLSGQVGAVFASINKKAIENLSLAYVPLPDQRRIVAKLDEAFAGIAKAIKNAERSAANAKAIFESELDAIFTRKGKDWTEEPLGSVVTFQGGSQPPKSVFSKEQKKGFVRLIQIRDYKTDNHVVYIPEKYARRLCRKDDVMIGRYGPPLFQILRGKEGAYNVALMKAIPDETQLLRDYLYYFLKNSHILAYVIHSSNRAAGQAGVNKATLEPYPIPFPKRLSEQAEIVSCLESLLIESESLESIYQRKAIGLEALKRSMLHHAFTGQL